MVRLGSSPACHPDVEVPKPLDINVQSSCDKSHKQGNFQEMYRENGNDS